MAFEGAILDFDGTLVDSIDAWHDLEGVLAREAQATVTLEDRKQLIPMSLDEIAQWFHGRFGLGKDARAVRNLMDEYMVDALSHSKALPGVEAFLESCKRAEVKLTVASSSPQLYLQTALKALGLLPYFEAVLSVEDLGTTKRQPGIFEEARRIMATPKEATWGFDDSFYALQVLHNAGYPPPSGSSIRTKATPLKNGNKKPMSSCEDSTNCRSQRWKHTQSRTSRRTRL